MNQSRVALTYFESFESFREEILNTHKNKKDELSALPYQRININNTYRINTSDRINTSALNTGSATIIYHISPSPIRVGGDVNGVRRLNGSAAISFSPLFFSFCFYYYYFCRMDIYYSIDHCSCVCLLLCVVGFKVTLRT